MTYKSDGDSYSNGLIIGCVGDRLIRADALAVSAWSPSPSVSPSACSCPASSSTASAASARGPRCSASDHPPLVTLGSLRTLLYHPSPPVQRFQARSASRVSSGWRRSPPRARSVHRAREPCRPHEPSLSVWRLRSEVRGPARPELVQQRALDAPGSTAADLHAHRWQGARARVGRRTPRRLDGLDERRRGHGSAQQAAHGPPVVALAHLRPSLFAPPSRIGSRVALQKPQLTSVTSIANRATGTGLSLAFYAFALSYAAAPALGIPFSGQSVVNLVANLPGWFVVLAKTALSGSFWSVTAAGQGSR